MTAYRFLVSETRDWDCFRRSPTVSRVPRRSPRRNALGRSWQTRSRSAGGLHVREHLATPGARCLSDRKRRKGTPSGAADEY